MSASDRTGSGLDWIAAPTGGSLFRTLTPAKGAAGSFVTARRILITGAGNLYLIPTGGSAGAGVFFKAVVAGEVVTQQCDGIGSSTDATGITVQS